MIPRMHPLASVHTTSCMHRDVDLGKPTGSGTHKLDAMVLGPVVHAALVKNRGASKHTGMPPCL